MIPSLILYAPPGMQWRLGPHGLAVSKQVPRAATFLLQDRSSCALSRCWEHYNTGTLVLSVNRYS